MATVVVSTDHALDVLVDAPHHLCVRPPERRSHSRGAVVERCDDVAPRNQGRLVDLVRVGRPQVDVVAVEDRGVDDGRRLASVAVDHLL